jgi:ApaG protein
MSKIKTLTTHGIKISVSTQYEADASNPMLKRFIHSYTINIENNSSRNVQLLSRFWLITDGDGSKREVKGEGVIGEQPKLYKGYSHTYSSWCPLTFPTGKMEGHFIMKDIDSDESLKVDIPSFSLIAGFKEN